MSFISGDKKGILTLRIIELMPGNFQRFAEECAQSVRNVSSEREQVLAAPAVSCQNLAFGLLGGWPDSSFVPYV